MDALIAEEEEFRIACTTSTSGKPPIRPPYTSIPHLSYTRYLVRDESPSHIAPIAVVQKRWMGDPALTVTRNASVLGAPKPTKDLAAVFPKLIRLLDLYRSAPTVGIEKEAAQTTTLISSGSDEEGGHAYKYDESAPDIGANQRKGKDTGATRKVGKRADRSTRAKADDVTKGAGKRSDRPSQPPASRNVRTSTPGLDLYTSHRGRHRTRRSQDASSAVNERSRDQESFDRNTKSLIMKQSMSPSGELRCKRQRRRGRTIDWPKVATMNEGKVFVSPLWAFGPSWTADKIGHYLRTCD
ncbi:hypothetical protein LTR93_011537 [Exophiala xenobiotica]|nr:hypothetical protein LTR93_011537 [Exophiala xenobiotica]